MASIPGSVRFAGFIAPTDSTDTFPVFKPIYGLGGLRTVASISERNAITTQRRENGMIVYVTADTIYYKLESGLTNSDWTVFNSGSGSGSFLPLSGGTVTGNALFSSSLSANNFNATVITGGTFISGSTNLYNIFAPLGVTSGSYNQPGSNISTGGTANNQTISLVASPQINNLYASGITSGTSIIGNTLSGGTIYSGSSDLSTVFMPINANFITGNGTANYLPLWLGAGSLTISSLYQDPVTGISIFNNVEITGDLTVLGTAYTTNTSIVQSFDNLIILNYSGNHLSAIGGGLMVQSGQTSGSPSLWIIDNFGNWSANTQIIAGGGLNINTGTTLSSGGTNLYSIFSTIAQSGGTSANLWSASTGLNSIIANNGSGNLASGQYSIVGGSSNYTSGFHTLIGVGYKNSATTNYSSVLNGSNNLANDTYSLVVGGTNNSVNASYGTIVGGGSNLISNDFSFIGNGSANIASGRYSFIGNGLKNSATTSYTNVVGGQQNIASGQYSFIGTGSGNTASGQRSFIGGGLGNIASGYLNSFIGNGEYNTSSGLMTTILGGKNNIASSDYSIIINGVRNTASGQFSHILGGSDNTANGVGTFIGNGQHNQASNKYSFIGTGVKNSTLSDFSTILNGSGNTIGITAKAASILAGTGHTLHGINSAIIGGGSISGTSDDTVYIPNARLAETPGSIIYSAGTDLYNIFAASNSGLQKFALSTGFTANIPKYIDHNLNLISSTDAIVQIWSGNSLTLGGQVSAVTTNQILITLAETGTYKIIIIG